FFSFYKALLQVFRVPISVCRLYRGSTLEGTDDPIGVRIGLLFLVCDSADVQIKGQTVVYFCGQVRPKVKPVIVKVVATDEGFLLLVTYTGKELDSLAAPGCT